MVWDAAVHWHFWTFFRQSWPMKSFIIQNKITRKWICILAIKGACTPNRSMKAWFLVPTHNSSFLLIQTAGSSDSRSGNCSDSCHPNMRPDSSSWLLVLPQRCCWHLESQWAHGNAQFLTTQSYFCFWFKSASEVTLEINTIIMYTSIVTYVQTHHKIFGKNGIENLFCCNIFLIHAYFIKFIFLGLFEKPSPVYNTYILKYICRNTYHYKYYDSFKHFIYLKCKETERKRETGDL